MRTINLTFTVLTLISIVLYTFGTPTSRFRRQLFNPSATSSSSNSGATSGSGFGSFAAPSWLKSMQSSTGFQLPSLPNPTFLNPDQIRAQAQDYISSVSKNIQDQYNQNLNKFQSLIGQPGSASTSTSASAAASASAPVPVPVPAPAPAPASPTNCASSEVRTEIIEINGRKVNQTTTSCISSGPGSVATSVSSSSVPVNNSN